ncbi:MAG TPA: hypothetical protein VF117_00685 [Gammaproteobacteria bacterium]
MLYILITVSTVPVCGILAYYLWILVINGKKLPLEANLVPVLSVHCHVKSDPIVGFSSGKNFYTTIPARFTIYGSFIVVKALSGRTYQRDHVIFAKRPGLFHQRLFIQLKGLGDAIEIIGKTGKIIPALKTAGYTLQEER